MKMGLGKSSSSTTGKGKEDQDGDSDFTMESENVNPQNKQVCIPSCFVSLWLCADYCDVQDTLVGAKKSGLPRLPLTPLKQQ